jgi:outer membrane protein
MKLPVYGHNGKAAIVKLTIYGHIQMSVTESNDHKCLFCWHLQMNRNRGKLAIQVHRLDGSARKIVMVRITTEQKRGKVILNVEGRLAGEWVGALEQCWRELRGSTAGGKFSINLCGVSFIDASGKILLKEIHRQGGQLVAEGCLNQAIVKEIVGQESDSSSGAEDEAASPKTKKSHIIFYAVFFSLLPGALTVDAQNASEASARLGTHSTLSASAPSGVLKLTLEQAARLAVNQNPTAQIALIQALQAVQDKNVARAALLPEVDASVKEQVQRVNILAQFGGKSIFPQIPTALGPFPVFSAGPSLAAPILDLTLWRRYQAARETVEASKANALSTREQVILMVVSQYIGTLRAVADVEASRSRVELAQALYEQAADLQKEGVGTGIDTLRANVELQNEKQRLIEAEADRERSLYGLSRLLNLDPRQTIELADALNFFDTPQPEVEPSIEEALGERQEWKSLNSQIKTAQLEKKEASDARLPNLRVDGNWAYLGTHPNDAVSTYTFVASVNMPVFTGGRIHAEVVRSNLEIQRLQQQQDDLRNSIALDVKTALINLTSARNEVQVATLGITLSQQEVDQARDRFRAGVANNIEVIQAQDALARAADNQIAALYRFNQARADYARSIGQMEKLYT